MDCTHDVPPIVVVMFTTYAQNLHIRTIFSNAIPFEKKSTRSPSASYNVLEIYWPYTNQDSFVRKILVFTFSPKCKFRKETGGPTDEQTQPFYSIAFCEKNAQTPECTFMNWLHWWYRRIAPFLAESKFLSGNKEGMGKLSHEHGRQMWDR